MFYSLVNDFSLCVCTLACVRVGRCMFVLGLWAELWEVHLRRHIKYLSRVSLLFFIVQCTSFSSCPEHTGDGCMSLGVQVVDLVVDIN